ncbi:MAG: hypothetical protein Q4B94_05755 [Pseudomonadota bacterium]|nr:hypothetical protein [Pseudomonadota bacterium]
MAGRARTLDKAFLVLFIAFAVLRLYGFVQTRVLAEGISGLGFALMAFGVWNRAFARLTEANLAQRRQAAIFGTYGGMLLILAALAMRWLG